MTKRNIVVGLLFKLCDITEAVQSNISNINKGDTRIVLKVIEKTLGEKELINELNGVEILLADPNLCASIFTCMPKSVKWIQSSWAGLDGMFSMLNLKDVNQFKPEFTLTRLGGTLGPSISEYVLGAIVALEKNFKAYFTAQQNKQWLLDSSKMLNFRLLRDLTVGILGAGDIGVEVARMLKSIGMQVHGLKKNAVSMKDAKNSPIDKFFTLDSMKEFLTSCDYLCSILPRTTETADLLSGNVLEVCKERKPGFINVGRGSVIDERSLLNALEKGWISSAFLDVFAIEPLPQTSQLWQMNNVTITPHISGLPLPNNVNEDFLKNLQLYIDGEPLLYVFDWEKGY